MAIVAVYVGLCYYGLYSTQQLLLQAICCHRVYYSEVKRGDAATTMDFPVRTFCTEAMEATTIGVAERMVGDDVARWVSPKGRLVRLRDGAKALR